MRALPALMLATCSLFSSLAVAGDKAQKSSDFTVNPHGYIQMWNNTALAGPSVDGLATDFYIRRARLIFKGTMSKDVSFFLGTLWANAGMYGAYGTPSVPDVWINWKVSSALQITTGQFITPFSRAKQSGAALHGLDLHTALFKRKGEAFGMRDTGIMARGLLADKSIDYRVALTDGVSSFSTVDETTGMTSETYSMDTPRVVGRLGYNLFDAEPQAHFKGMYQGKKKIVSFGVSFDVEPGIVGADKDTYYAAAFDWLVDMPSGDNELVLLGAGYYYGPGGFQAEGVGFFNELGYRFGEVEPLIGVEMLIPNEGDVGQRTALMPGVNWWADGHHTSLKFQVGAVQAEGASDWDVAATTQLEVFR